MTDTFARPASSIAALKVILFGILALVSSLKVRESGTSLYILYKIAFGFIYATCMSNFLITSRNSSFDARITLSSSMLTDPPPPPPKPNERINPAASPKPKEAEVPSSS
ncbi:hypothetical protein Barb7_00300 [Bacteroidales bacterium Barb7]|nr:hypothetical protein Barb7_00300 [Bacteroidales bacterium Barb7]